MEDIEISANYLVSTEEWQIFHEAILDIKSIDMVFESLVKEMEKLPNWLKLEIMKNSMHDSEVISALYDYYFDEIDEE
jgi:hypothetical protein